MKSLNEISKEAKAAWVSGLYCGVVNAEAWRDDPAALLFLAMVATVGAKHAFREPLSAATLAQVLEFFDGGYTDHALAAITGERPDEPMTNDQ